MTGSTISALQAIEILRAWGEFTTPCDSLEEEKREMLLAVVQEMQGPLPPERMAVCCRLLAHLTQPPRRASALCNPVDAV